MLPEPSRENETVHYLKNQLSIILGFTDLLVADTPSDDPRRDDLEQIRKAAIAALSRVPELKALSPGVAR